MVRNGNRIIIPIIATKRRKISNIEKSVLKAFKKDYEGDWDKAVINADVIGRFLVYELREAE